MSTNNNTGYLEIILGCMYAGKTSRIVEIYKKYKFCNNSIVVINHTLDDRYNSTDEQMTTHDKITIPCIKTTKLLDLWLDDVNINDDECVPRLNDKFKLAMCDVVLINEGQFFEDLEEFVKNLLDKNKKIYVCGLDGDFKRQKFGNILDLIPLCDKVEKLSSLCAICRDGTPGIFSQRISLEKEQTVVGANNYVPVCRKCYVKM
jgi:thymidine kinase